MANTRETMGEQACLDALVADTLTSFEDDSITKVGYSCLTRKKALTSVTLSGCKSIEGNGLSACTKLEVVDMLGTGTIASSAFSGDAKLVHLLLRGTSKTSLADTNAFADTPISRVSGAIYVDESLLSTYKADARWGSGYFITTLDKYPASDFSTIEDDWPTIIAKAEAGTAADSYSIGDTKLIDLGAEGKVYAQIVAFGVDTLASDSSKTAGITFITKGMLATKKRMNPSNSSGAQGTGGNGGWEFCELRSYLANTVLPLFPTEIQSAIKVVTKYSDYIVPGQTVITHDQETQDQLWIPSVREVIGGSSYEQTGPKYTSCFGSDRARVKYDESGSSTTWWLRTVETTSYFRNVAYAGYRSSSSANNSHGVVLGFCI